MRATTNLQFYSIVLLFLTTFAAAWPSWLPQMGGLVVRDTTTTAASSASPAASKTASSSPTATDSNSKSNSQSGSSSATATDKGSDSASSATGSNTITAAPSSTDGSNSNSSTTDHTSYDPSYQAGGVSLLTPAQLAGSQFYKVGDNVTFAWNYTSLMATPTAVDVLASCSSASQYFTLTQNMTVTNATQSVTWDTGAYITSGPGLQNPLLTAVYTLVIFDADSAVTAQAQPGYLAVYNQYQFGMYTPQPYTPLNEFKCATCSSAMSDMERRVIGLVFGMGAITFLSFTWFVTGLGVIW